MQPAEEQRFTEYVREQLPALRRVAYRLCGETHRADDIVQTAMTRLYLHWRRANAARNMDAYVRGMVVRAFLSDQRGSWRRRVSLVGAATDGGDRAAAPVPETDPRSAVFAALRRLPPRQRAVLVLRFVYDLPVHEVAGHLGCTAGNVTGLSARGVRALRTQLGQQWPATLGTE